jgi:hypothetical protein
MQNADMADGNAFPHEVEINLDVLGALVLDGVGGHVDGADVVAIDQRCAARRSMKLEEKLSEPRGLRNAVGHGAVLGFGAGAGLLTVKIRQPSHEFTFGVGMSFIPYPLVLTPVV